MDIISINELCKPEIVLNSKKPIFFHKYDLMHARLSFALNLNFQLLTNTSNNKALISNQHSKGGSAFRKRTPAVRTRRTQAAKGKLASGPDEDHAEVCAGRFVCSKRQAAASQSAEQSQPELPALDAQFVGERAVHAGCREHPREAGVRREHEAEAVCLGGAYPEALRRGGEPEGAV